jgi:putative flippase GtrA
LSVIARIAPAPGGTIGRELVGFAAIGVASTGAYVLLFSALRFVASASIANAAALVVTAVANTAANRRLTFRVPGGGRSVVRDQIAGLVALGIALAITTASIGLLDRIAPNASRSVELAVLVAANAAATGARFVILRYAMADHAQVDETR